MRSRTRRGAAALPLLLALAACRMGPGPADTPDTRPSDGVLERADLQELVAAQTRRDAAALIDALRSSDADVRARAAFALGSVQAREAVPALEALLDDGAAAVRRDAAFALGQSGDPAAEGPLLSALEIEGEARVRRALVEALGRAGGGEALSGLTARTPGGPLWSDRTLAMARLLLAGAEHPPAVDSLASWLDARDPGVRFQAARFFARTPQPALRGRHGDALRGALDGYELDDPAAMHVVTALGEMDADADTASLIFWLRHARDWRIQSNAALALSARSDRAAVRQALLESLDHASPHVRESAGEALAARPQPRAAVAAVRAHVVDNPGDWRAAGPLLSILAAAGEGETVLAWIDRWPPSEAGPWTRAVEVLASMGGDAPLERLAAAAASGEPLVSATALRALARRWPAERNRPAAHDVYWEAFSRAAREDDGSGLAAAVAVLPDTVFLARGALPLLLRVWERIGTGGDPELAAEVLSAIAETGSEDALAALRDALDHPDPRIADAAAEALLSRAGEEVELPAWFEEEGDTAASVSETTGRPSARERTVDWDALRRLGLRPRLVLDTEEGRVVVALVPEEAPVTVQTLAGLAAEGRFDGVPFHRVVPNFVVQGGDVGRGDGTGGPGFAIPSELTSIRFGRGAAGMASSGKDTEGSQFFLTHAPQPHLDGGYTAFGWVVEGMDVVDRLVRGQRIVRAAVEPGP